MRNKPPRLGSWQARTALAFVLTLPALVALAQRGAGEGLSSQREAWVTANAFDPQALTVTLESIDLREKQIAERENQRSVESRAMAEQCAAPGRKQPAAAPMTIPAPTLPAGSAVRSDLEGKSLDELTRLYAETRDPAIQAAVARLVTAQAMRGLPGATPVAPVAVPSVGSGPMGRAMDEAMKRQLAGMDPSMGKCLDAAETKDREDVGGSYFLRSVDTRAARELLRTGRATTVLLDVLGFVSKPDKNGVAEATSPVGRYLRFNVVTQSHPAARQASSLDEATEERTKNPRGGLWPDPPALRAATSQSPRPDPTSLPPGQRPPGPPAAQKEAPAEASAAAIGIDLESDERFKQSNPGAYDAYVAMSELMVGKEEAAYKKMPSQRELSDMSHTDREKLVNQRQREIADEAKAREQALRDFTSIFLGTPVPPRLEDKKRIFGDRIDAIDALDGAAQSEVLGRLVRDVKEVNDNGSKQLVTLTLARALFNIFPQAKTVSVKYRSRLTLGATNSQSNAFDDDIPVARLKVKSGSVADYLSENSVMMTKLARDAYATAYGMQRDQVENMLSRNQYQRSGK